MSPSPFDTLPVEIRDEVLRFIPDSKSLSRAARVHPAWTDKCDRLLRAKKYTTHVLELSELFSVEGEYITNGSYRTILSSVRGVKHLCLDGQRNNLGTLDLSHKLFSGLDTLDLRYMAIGDVAITTLPSHLVTLRNLPITPWLSGPLISSSARTLQHLHVSIPEEEPVAVMGMNQEIAAVGPNLRSFAVSSWYGFEADSSEPSKFIEPFLKVFSTFKKLETLELACSPDDLVAAISKLPSKSLRTLILEEVEPAYLNHLRRVMELPSMEGVKRWEMWDLEYLTQEKNKELLKEFKSLSAAAEKLGMTVLLYDAPRIGAGWRKTNLL